MVRSAGRGRKPQWRAVIPELLKHPPKSNIPPPLEMITRAEWSAVPWIHMDSDIRLKFPIMHLRHTFTDTDECKNPEECIPFLQQLQKDSQEKGFPDLMYNFLIGSDGMLYEGRGFDWKCTVFDDPWVDSKGESLNIAYIGRFHNVVAPWRFRLTAKRLTKWMLQNCLLHEDHEMTPSICWPEDYKADFKIPSAALDTDVLPKQKDFGGNEGDQNEHDDGLDGLGAGEGESPENANAAESGEDFIVDEPADANDVVDLPEDV